jgi:hypothetical protein
VQEQEDVKNGMNNIFHFMIQKELIDWTMQPMAMTFNKNPKLHKNQDFIVFTSSFVESFKFTNNGGLFQQNH